MRGDRPLAGCPSPKMKVRMISITRRWLWLVLVAAFAGPAAAAGPNFSTSTASHEPANVIAGDVVRYTVTVTNTGGTADYARLTTTLPRGYFIRANGDCSTAKRNDDRIVWYESPFPADATRQCRIDLLTRRQAARTLAPLATEILAHPSGYHRVETRPELATPPDPNSIRVGRFGVTRVGLVVLAVLGIALAGGVIVMAAAARSGADRRFALGAWVAVCTSVGFLLHFVGLAYNDYRSYTAYREASCYVFDSTIDKLQSRNSESGTSYTYTPEFAVSYTALDTETYASVTPPASSIKRNSIGPAQQQVERFAVGSVQPCWYDPNDLGMVLLMRGPGAAYLFALLPLAPLILFAWVLCGLLPSRIRRAHVA
jgi:uncharacterized repeat protein (TIGR01451 family)